MLYFEEGKYINDVVLSYSVGLLSRHAKKISREKACQDEIIHCQGFARPDLTLLTPNT